MLLGRITNLTGRRSIHVASVLKQAMTIDGNNILAESLKRQVNTYLIINLSYM